jgi:hypothetical protein
MSVNAIDLKMSIMQTENLNKEQFNQLNDPKNIHIHNLHDLKEKEQNKKNIKEVDESEETKINLDNENSNSQSFSSNQKKKKNDPLKNRYMKIDPHKGNLIDLLR